MSRTFILKPFGSLISSISAKSTPAVVSLRHATWIDVNPRPFKWRTKIPMLPQNSPAMIISMLPKVPFFSTKIPPDEGIITRERELIGFCCIDPLKRVHRSTFEMLDGPI